MALPGRPWQDGERRGAAPLTGRAESTGADLVVLGTRRRSALAKALLGSVESAVLGMSGRPVLLVPPPRS